MYQDNPYSGYVFMGLNHLGPRIQGLGWVYLERVTLAQSARKYPKP